MGRFERKARRNRRRLADRLVVAFQPGLAGTDAELEEVKKTTHDTLIDSWGNRRRSGVSWRIIGPGPAVTPFIHRLHRFGVVPDWWVDGALEFLAGHPEAILVVAQCDILNPDRHGASR